jgi:hypothetical protein
MKRRDRHEAVTMLKAANAAFARESRPCASKAIEHAPPARSCETQLRDRSDARDVLASGRQLQGR